jgi:3-dehydroquinate synthase
MQIKNITVDIPIIKNEKYEVWLKRGILKEISLWMPAHASRVIIITDNIVKKLYAAELANKLRKSKYDVSLLAFSAGEKSKGFKTYLTLLQALIRLKVDRNTLILSLGGGVVGDIAGFVAATYMRGISYIQIPTTLLAMVDSSIGGKTGINMAAGKNLAGAFWQPVGVVTDVSCLASLSNKHFINGLFEVIKIFLTCDKSSLHYFKAHLLEIMSRDPIALVNLIQRAIKLKTEIIAQDVYEKHLRMVLNFGHTLGHAIEKTSHYKILHGYAVGFGMLIEAKIAELSSLLPSRHFLMIQALLAELGITPLKLKKLKIDKIINYTHIDKKNRDNKVRYILLSGLGQVFVDKKTYAHYVPDKTVKTAFLAVTGE